VTDAVSTAKWTGKWLLQLPVYLVTSYLVRTLIGSSYHLLIIAGADLPTNFLLQHFLWVGLVGGFIAGLVGVLAFRAVLLLPLKLAPVAETPWKGPQAWTWFLPACWLLFGIMAWSANHTRHSVLATTAGPGTSGVIDAFFGSACSLTSGGNLSAMVLSCTSQLTFTHPWLGTLGYSVAAFVPRWWFGWFSHHNLPEKPTENTHSEEMGKRAHV
jgi:hypothetical protein